MRSSPHMLCVCVCSLVQSRGTFLITFPYKPCIHYSPFASFVISIQCLFILSFLVTEGNVRELTF